MPGGASFSLRILFCAGSGVVTGLAFQPFNLWGLLFVGVAGLTLALGGSGRLRSAPLLGLAYGLGLTGTTLNWMSAIFIEAMVALVITVALFYAALAVAVKISLRARCWPLLAAGCWTAVEALLCRWPFDGFGWVRAGYAMIDSPLAGGLPLIGVAGVGFVSVLCGQWLAWLVLQLRQNGLGWARLAKSALGVAALVAVCLAGYAVPPSAAADAVAVGWVQGGAPGGGVYGLGVVRTITKNQLAETRALIAEVESGAQPSPEFIVWPENGSDLDPFADAQTMTLLQESLAAADRPVLFGIISSGPGPEERQTAALWWAPGQEPGPRYAKRGIVPFGEWVPYRDLLLPLIPKLSYVGAQSVPGDEPGVMSVSTATGRQLKLGVLICYDITFDSYVYDLVRGGAELIAVQSSNAMYQGTGQIEQQFAMTRARAAELRREILVTTTSGISGFIGPGGEVVQRIPDSQPAHGIVTMPLRTGETPVVFLAPVVELVVALGSLLGVLVVGWTTRRKCEE
ncbi:MAG: apolipoprotein N-acyltransferase [Propionibacteriaceae bacterium]|jgi:apolipoprotein N-acyltransferase|nr:apolipoprotein N-acyltransferase [Propionibacteriaceae bacterium]